MKTPLKEIRYETPIADIDFTKPSLFLAGPTVRGNQPHLTSWRFEAIRLFASKGFEGNLIIPEFTDKTESGRQQAAVRTVAGILQLAGVPGASQAADLLIQSMRASNQNPYQ